MLKCSSLDCYDKNTHSYSYYLTYDNKEIKQKMEKAASNDL